MKAKPESSLKPAIILSAHTMGLGIIRGLGRMGVPIISSYYNKKDMGYVSKYVQQAIFTPHPEKDENKFIEAIETAAKHFKGSVLIPADDGTLAAVSRHKEILSDYYIVACTEWDITQRFIDKMYTWKSAASAGIPVPNTIAPHSEKDLEKLAGTIQYPCLVKPRQSHLYYDIFKTKMVRVNNDVEMLDIYRQAAGAGLEVLIQEIIPGDDSQVVNYNSYFWDGKPLVEFTARQIRKAPPEFGAPRVVVSEVIPEVIEAGRAIIRAIGFYGYSCTEFKKDPRDGRYKLMEVNGRHNRSTLLAVRCGLNFPWLQYRHLVQGELPEQHEYRTGIFWISLDRDIGYGIKYRRTEKYSLSQYLRPYLRPHVFDTLDWKDLNPFTKRCKDIIISLMKGTFFSRKRSHQRRIRS